jgi:lipid-binding SYLF domain-containing protein
MTTKTNLRLATLVVAMAVATGGAYAQSRSTSTTSSRDGSATTTTTTTQHDTTSHNAKRHANEAADAQEQVDRATQVVNEMRGDPGVAKLLDQARGVLIVPKYAKGAFIVGGEGGAAVALLKNHGAGKEWSAPAFYHVGGASIGAAAGGQSGSIAMLLMTEKATEMLVNHKNKFSFNGDAGLTVVNWSANAQASSGGDVIVWSDVKGAFAGASVGVKDVKRDEDANQAFYGRNTVEPSDILTGKVTTARADTLRNALGRATG